MCFLIANFHRFLKYMKEKLLVNFGGRIRILRKERKWTQTKLAEKTGFHYNYIGMIERGERNPSLINIGVFAEAFEIKIDDLLSF